MTQSFSLLFGGVQGTLLILFLACTTTDINTHYAHEEYVIFRDIMVMLLLGFGYLMTFLHKYGLGAVGLTMMLTILAIQLNIFVEAFARYLYDGHTSYPLKIDVFHLIDGEFAAATLLISFGAVIGRATPMQMLIMAIMQSFFYAINKVMIVFGEFGAEDVGGTMTIHMFGAYFGLAASRAFLAPKPMSSHNAASNAVSDVLSLVGTTLLWVYWPSFVGATESANPDTENKCIVHTVLALLGSTGATFFLSHKLTGGKFDPVHIANSTLAGGVAVGASGRLDMTPGGAVLLGILAGSISVVGYVFITPFLEEKLCLFDTCGVHNLHGLPSVLGGLASLIFVTMDSDAEFFLFDKGEQAARQLAAVVVTIIIAICSGLLTGSLMVKIVRDSPEEYTDAAWWEGEYFEDVAFFPDDKSGRSHRSVRPIEAENKPENKSAVAADEKV